MCGIGGVVVAPGAEVDATWLEAMVGRLHHRGPDDRGMLLWRRGAPAVTRRERPTLAGASVGFAHTRLSILDLSPAGWQPMSTPDGRLHLVFNGEIYNYVELRAVLERAGHVFRSECDTEVLLAAYREWGSDALTRLVGMFAFAVLDVANNEIFLARDFFGIKPFLYATWSGGLAFASEINALFAVPHVSRRVNASALYDYLHLGLTDHREQTVFADIRHLPPAHYARVSLDAPDRIEPVEYWRPTAQKHDIPFDEAATRIRELFEENIRLHLRSDVPVGTALSGGIDSSAILTVMRDIAGADADINSFSYLADDPRIDEERWVDLAADASRARVHKVRVTPEELVADLDHLIVCQGEPFGSTSIYAQHRVFRLAAEAGVPVMLDGQGADELFAGYRSYLAARLASLVRSGHFVAAARLIAGVRRLPDTDVNWRVAVQAATYVVPERLKPSLRRLLRRDPMPPWLDSGWFLRHGVDGRQVTAPGSGLGDALRTAFSNTSLPSLLRYEDRNSMAFSIESRVPFLTPALVDYVFSLPEEHFVSEDGLSKAVFRAAMRGITPDAILDRRDKIGFQTPEQRWLNLLSPWVDQILRGEAARRVPALHVPAVQEHWSAVLRGQRPFDWRIWRWLNVVRWSELYDVEYR
jgi:asparagine synthase (glutamine-hydrolysing)